MPEVSTDARARVRLNRADARLIAIAVAIAAVSLWVALRYFHLAFPEAAIEFRVTDAQAAGIGRAFLAARGLPTAGWQHASRFNYDDDAKVFLERELGLTRTGELLRTRVHLWRWEQRWFRPLTREEMRVAVTPAGEVVGFAHPIAEAAPGARLSPPAARALAERFLTEAMRLDLSRLEFIGSSRLDRPNRTDYDFTWKDRAPLASGPGVPAIVAQAEYRREVRIEGGAVGGYEESLHVPDAWLRSYQQLRAQNNTASTVDALLIVLLGIGLLVALIERLRRGDVRWRVALWVGGAGAVLSFLAALNGFSLTRFDYPTTQSYGAFLTRGLVGDALSAFALGVFLALLTAAAEPLYRQRFSRQPALASYLSWRGVRSKAFFFSVLLGIVLAIFFFAYQTVFYLIANHLGAWAPADVPYDELLNTRFPWIFVLLGGFFPAIFEEFMFRMGAIPLFEGWLARRPRGERGGTLSFRSPALWIAVVAAALIWGFGHSAYPNEPFYIRGVEVGIGGVILGWVMVRFGILTTVVWHYTVDALYTALLLLRSPNSYFRVSGGVTALIFALPLLVAIAAYAVTGTFSNAQGVRNEDAGTAPPLPPAPAAPPPSLPAYRRVSPRAWIAGGVAAAALLAAYAAPLASWRAGSRFTSTPAEAIATARAYLAAQGLATAGFRAVATVESAQAPPAAHFIFTRAGRAAVVRAYSQVIPGLIWRVRFFRPLQEEEFVVALRPDGRTVAAFSRQVPEAAPGAAPSLAAAQRVAAAALAQVRQDVSGMQLETATQQTLPHRVDSDFVWQDPPASPRNFGDIRYRLEAQTIGDRFGGFRAFFYVPEASVRAFEKTTLAEALLRLAPAAVYGGLFVIVLWFLFRFVREREARWRPILLWALAGGLALVIAAADRWPAMIAQYRTDVPWRLWQVFLAVEIVFAFIGGFLATTVLFAPLQLTAPKTAALANPAARRLWARDAFWAGLLALVWMAGWHRWDAVLNAWGHRFGAITLASAGGLDTLVPGLAGLAMAPFQALWGAALLGIVVPALAMAWRDRRWRPWLAPALLLLCLGTLPPVHTAAQFAFELALTAAEWVLAGIFIWIFLRDNPLAYLSAGLLAALLPPALEYWQQGAPRYHAAAVVLLAAAAAWLIWLAAQTRVRADRSAPTSAPSSAP